jgi:hypothetical protein
MMNEIEEIRHRAGITEATVSQIDDETFMSIIDLTLRGIGTLNPSRMTPQQKQELVKRVATEFKKKNSRQPQEPELMT